MEKKTKFNIWYIFLALWGVISLHSLWIRMYPQVQQIPYSQFQTYLSEGRIEEVRIGKTQIQGKLKNPEQGAPANFMTVRVEPELAERLSEQNVRFAGEIESTFLRDLLSWVVPVLLFAAVWVYLFRRLGQGGGLGSFMAIGKNKAKIYMEKEVKTTFANVAGVDEAKEELREVIEFLKRPEKFSLIGGKIPKGILLAGPPGTGKTLLAKALAGEAGVPFFSISGSEFVEMFVGVGAARVRDLFLQAREKAPCIIFIDELDALGKARGIGPVGHEEREQTLNQLLVEMDGFDSRSGVVLMAATNRPEILDPALLRPGRFDRHVVVDRPDKAGRFAILQLHAQGVRLDSHVDLEIIAGMTPGFVGADLANIINEAALLAVRQGKEMVEQSDLLEAVERVIAGMQKKNRVLNREEKERVAHHEVGHALVALKLQGPESVHKISIIPRGVAALGYTLQLPTEDRFLMTKSELENRIAVLLGGRIAEEIMYGEVSTGARDDLLKATDIARHMVKAYGMSEKLGQVSFDRNHQPFFLQNGQSQSPGDYSQQTAYEIDTEVRRIIDEQDTRVKEILGSQRETIQEVARVLLIKETISGEELKTILEKSGNLSRVKSREVIPVRTV